MLDHLYKNPRKIYNIFIKLSLCNILFKISLELFFAKC